MHPMILLVQHSLSHSCAVVSLHAVSHAAIQACCKKLPVPAADKCNLFKCMLYGLAWAYLFPLFAGTLCSIVDVLVGIFYDHGW